MKKRLYIIVFLCSLVIWGCSDKDELEAPVEIGPDYILPQGNASKEDNDRIQALKDKYGSYFLYVMTQKDFEWVQSTGSGASAIDSVVLGKPEDVGNMLKYLDDIWLKYLPENFKKAGGLPYRVMMVDVIRQRRRGTGWPPGREYLYFDFKIVGRSIAIAGMNASLKTMTRDEKLIKRNAFQAAIWQYYLGNGIVKLPADFYNISNYVVAPVLPVGVSSPANREAYRQKGFLPGGYFGVSDTMEWYNGAYSWTTAKTNDLNSYLLHLTQRTDEQMAPYMAYPLIKEKFNLLVNHFKNTYGIDVRAMANDQY